MKRKERDYGQESDRNLKMVIGLARNYLYSERETSAFLAGFGITLPQFGVLEALYHLGDMKIGELTEKTLSTGGCMTVVLRNMAKEGLVRKEQDPGDKRASLVTLTAKGESLIEEIFPLHLEKLRERFAPLDNEEKDQMIGLLKKLSRI